MPYTGSRSYDTVQWLSLGIVCVGLGAFLCFGVGRGVAEISHGLGDHIEWVSLETGLAESKKKRKPLMLIIHKSWCGACKALKPKFRDSLEIAELSKSFLMVNTQDDDEPEGDIYRPDGGYIPRILFFDPSGELLEDITGENPSYKYYYYNDASIASAMARVLQLSSTWALDENGNNQNNQTKTEL